MNYRISIQSPYIYICPNCWILCIFPISFSLSLFNLPNVNQRNPIRNVRSWEIRIDTLIGRLEELANVTSAKLGKNKLMQIKPLVLKASKPKVLEISMFDSAIPQSQPSDAKDLQQSSFRMPGTQVKMLASMSENWVLTCIHLKIPENRSKMMKIDENSNLMRTPRMNHQIWGTPMMFF